MRVQTKVTRDWDRTIRHTYLDRALVGVETWTGTDQQGYDIQRLPGWDKVLEAMAEDLLEKDGESFA